MRISLKYLFIVWCFWVSIQEIRSQQETNLTLYTYHMNMFNPAVVGNDGEAWVNVTSRKQWSNIDYAPETQAVSLSLPLGNNVGVGVSVIQDRTFIESQTGVSADFSYQIRLGQSTRLNFGIKAGGNNYSLNTDGLQTYNYLIDPSLENLSLFNPIVGVGFYLTGNDYFVSLSVPKLLSTDRADDNGGVVTVAESRSHWYLSSGYVLPLSNNVELAPSLLVRYVQGAPLSMDVLSELRFYEKFSLGLSYRTDQAISGIMSLRLAKRFIVGYAYENSLRNSLQAFAGNTHELVFRFLLAKKSVTD